MLTYEERDALAQLEWLASKDDHLLLLKQVAKRALTDMSGVMRELMAIGFVKQEGSVFVLNPPRAAVVQLADEHVLILSLPGRIDLEIPL